MTATATTQPLAAPVRNPTSAGTISTPAQRTEIVYPESDGEPIADNTKQFRYIVVIQGGIAALFADNPNVFVAGDLLRYPVEGNNKIWAAPDTIDGVRPAGRPATGSCNDLWDRRSLYSIQHHKKPFPKLCAGPRAHCRTRTS